jgi:secreted PhoX family phosphatase
MSFPKWLRLPSRIALLLGLGALSATCARADAGHDMRGGGTEPISQDQHASSDNLLVWSEGGRLYVSEDGSRAEELRLGDTAEARHLRQLLQQHGAASSGVRLDRMILAGGGGKGISWSHWKPVGSERTGNPTKTGVSERTTVPRNINTPQQAGASGNLNSAGTENKK